MNSLTAFYRHGHGQTGVPACTHADLHTVLAEAQGLVADQGWSVLIAFLPETGPTAPEFNAGVNGEHGLLQHAGAE